MHLRFPTACALALGALLAAGHAQGYRGVQLLSRFDPNTSCNDVWGYVSPEGKEYAILGTNDGAHVIDASDPRRPVPRGYIDGARSGWASSTWRDMRTYRNWLYIVTEGGGGVQIVDLKDPDRPRFVKTFGQALWSNAHNVAIDTGAGTLYPCGTDRGTPILDLAADPENPRLIATYAGNYVHDLHVQDGYAHLGEFNRVTYRILDVRNLPVLTTVGTAQVPACHNAWPSRDNRIAVTTSEQSNGALSVFDISVKSRPVRLATFRAGASGTSVHNAYIKDRVCHIAHYSEGYVAVDLSDPARPVETGFYDTSESASGYNGNWGCYPFQPSGVVYASDRENGLFILAPLASAARYGAATAGTGGRAPRLYPFGAAWRGNGNFALEVEGLVPNTDVLLVLGGERTSVQAGGLTVLVDLLKPHVGLPARADASGKATVKLPIPLAARGTLHAQAFQRDANGPLGLIATRGLTFEVFLR